MSGWTAYLTDIVIDSDIESKIEHAAFMKGKCLEAAKKVASIAEAAAPVDVTGSDGHTGRYKATITAEATGQKGAVVVADSPEATFIEFGVPSHGIAPRYILRNAALAAGLTFGKE